MRLTFARWSGGERGSIPLAMLATLMISGLAVAITATVAAGQRHTQFDDGYERALQVAEIGADRIGVVIDNNLTPSDTGWVTVGTNGDRFNATVVEDPSGFTIESTGEARAASAADPVRRKIVVRIQRPPIFKHALFGDVAVHATGTARKMRSYSSATGIYSGDTPPGNKATLASNEAVHASGSTNGGTTVYPPDKRFDVATDAAVSFITQSIAACAGQGPIEPMVIQGTQVMEPATFLPDPWHDDQPFYCASDLIFDLNSVLTIQNATAANPVKIFVTGSILFERNASVNCGTGCVADEDAPNAGLLQIYTSSSSQVIFGKDVRAAAALYAPRAQCSGGANINYWGSMVCRVAGEFTGHFRLYYDETLSTILGSAFRRWSEEAGV